MPAERAEARGRSSDIGKRRWARMARISWPTAPVAPTTATRYCLLTASPLLRCARHSTTGLEARASGTEGRAQAQVWRVVMGRRCVMARGWRHLGEPVAQSSSGQADPQCQSVVWRERTVVIGVARFADGACESLHIGRIFRKPHRADALESEEPAVPAGVDHPVGDQNQDVALLEGGLS